MRVQILDRFPLLDPGASWFAATRDAELRPAITRGWGAELLTDPYRIRLCIEAPPDSATRMNLCPDADVSLSVTHLSTRMRCQMKCQLKSIDENPGAEQLRSVERHREGLGAELGEAGVPPRLAARVLDRSALISTTLLVIEASQETTEGMPAS